MRPKILFATPVLHYPAVGGPSLRIENSIKALSQVSDLTIYSRVSLNTMGGNVALSYYKELCKKFYFAPFTNTDYTIVSFLMRVLNALARKLSKRNIFYVAGESERDYYHLLKTADNINADLIWLGYGNISYPLLKYIKENSSYKVVVDTDSVWSRFVLRGLPYIKNDKEKRRREAEGKTKVIEEKWGTMISDVTTAVSEVDKEYYQSLVKDKSKVMIFSNVIDLENYKHNIVSNELKRPAIYLAGTFWKGSPMEESAIWMIERVMPYVWEDYPDAHFYIIGNGSLDVLGDILDKRVHVLGKVPSVLQYLLNVDVVVVPLKYESGTRFKILEAGACGIPIVSTTLGAEGIPVIDGEHVLLDDSPSDFADSIKWLLRNKEEGQKMASRCRDLIAKNYSISKATEEALEIIENVISRERKQ